MRYEQLVKEKREEILRIASKHGARDVRVFVSVTRGEADRDRANFERDELLQSWFLRHLQIIGEASRASPKTCEPLLRRSPGRTSSTGGWARTDTPLSGHRILSPKGIPH
jgi:hypothetical protein